MKILILKNKGVNEKFVEQEIENLKFFKNIKKNFQLPNIPYTLEVRDIDFDVKVKKKGTASNGKSGYTLKTLPTIPTGFDRVAIMYDGVPIFNGGGNFAYSHKKRINGAFVTEIPDSSDNHVLPHELMHLECNEKKEQGFNVIDSMDKTKVDGKLIPYYKNNTPTAHLGNYHVTLLSINKYKDNSKQTLINSIMAQIAILTAQLKSKKKSKWFSPLETKGLDEDFVLNYLEPGREESGTPWIINSGYRNTSKGNHGLRRAVDLKCVSGKLFAIVKSMRDNGYTPAETYDIVKSIINKPVFDSDNQALIVRGAIKTGITRIGVYNVHCHIDDSPNRTSPTIWYGTSE